MVRRLGTFFRGLMFALCLAASVAPHADRVADERVNAAFMRLELRADQREPFAKLLKDYYARRNMLYKREAERSQGGDMERHLQKPLDKLGQKTLKKMAEVLDETQMVDARALIDAATTAFLSDLSR